jgi:preprotein translocase subunit SecG
MRLPEREGDWQIIIGTLMLACSIVLVLLAESKNRQAEEILKEAKQTIKEVCHE